TADGWHSLGAYSPVGEIAILGNLICTENCHVEMATAHHCEAVGVVEESRAGLQRDRLLASIDQIPIFLPPRRRFAEIQYAVFRMENRLTAFRLVAGHHLGKTNT